MNPHGDGETRSTITWRRHRPTIRVVGYPNHFKHYVAGARVPHWLYAIAYRRLEP